MSLIAWNSYWRPMHRSIRNPWLVLAALGGLAYPLLVYFGISRLPTGSLVLFGLVLIALRFGRVSGSLQPEAGATAMILACAGLLATLLVAPASAALAYPVVVSLASAMVFGLSLINPPTVIERIARVREPDLPPRGVAYARQVTLIWMLFLIANAAVSACLAAWGSVAAWALWNGLLSYLLMGAILIGEIGVRRIVRRRAATP
jgi:uncharacterized membrane protein